MKKRMITAFVSAIMALTTVPIYANATSYTVVEGDCWSTIAEQYNITVPDLVKANNTSEDAILQIGEVLNIPTIMDNNISSTYDSNNNVYYPEKGEGWYAISKKTGIALKDLLSYNNATLSTLVIHGEPIKLSSNSVITTTITSNVSTSVTTTTTKNNYTNLIGSKTLYNTPYGNSWYNITYMAKKLNGVVVSPGETFSMYNYYAFPNHCNQLDGFKESYAYDNDGNLITSYGGGICFTSTVFYQCAVLECGLESVERHNHAKQTGYAKLGEDAALNLDTDYVQDMKFKNTSDYAIQFIFTSDYLGGLTVTAYECH